jgi:hypothetical protein
MVAFQNDGAPAGSMECRCLCSGQALDSDIRSGLKPTLGAKLTGARLQRRSKCGRSHATVCTSGVHGWRAYRLRLGRVSAGNTRTRRPHRARNGSRRAAIRLATVALVRAVEAKRIARRKAQSGGNWLGEMIAPVMAQARSGLAISRADDMPA